MFRTIHALVLVAGLFGLVGQGIAQDPKTERPGQPQPMPAPMQPKQAPAVAPLLVKTLEGSEEGLATGPLTFHLFQNGRVLMIDVTKKSVAGTIKADGNRLQLVFDNCVYEGREQKNGTFNGIARVTSGPDVGKTWTFGVSLRESLVGRSYAGKETLLGYGDVTFRFVNSKTVEMTDRDGTVRGTYAQNGSRVAMTFGATVYTGELNADSFAGSARDTRHHWTFHVNNSK